MSTPSDSTLWADRQVALVDLLDRLLAGGVVLTGDVVLSIADVDLVQVSLRALIRSVPAEGGALWTEQGNDRLPPGSTPTMTPSSAT